MARFKRPPKGYKINDFPLVHEVAYNAELSLLGGTDNYTYLTLFRASKAITTPENVEVNPMHSTFAEEGGVTCAMGSIVDNLRATMTVKMTKGAIETDKLRNIKFTWMPIYNAFDSHLISADDKTTTTVENILFLKRDTTVMHVEPDFNAVDDTGGNLQPWNTVSDTEVASDWDLTTNNVLEYVQFLKTTFKDASKYYSNGGALRAVTGLMHAVYLERDKTYRVRFPTRIMPKVKRMNPYTYCGILVGIELGRSTTQFDQIPKAADCTAIPHVDVSLQESFDEWNTNWEQSPQ